MAEAAAFGLAVNVLTVLDYGRQFAVAAWRIYQYGVEGVPGLSNLKVTSENLRNITKQLRQTVAQCPSGGQNEADKTIFKLADRCDEIAARILTTVDSLRIPHIPDTNRGRKKNRGRLEAVVAALKVSWKSDEIKELEAELDRLRSEIVVNIAVSLR